MLKHVDENNFEEEVLNSKKAVLVDFFATWCGPCQMLGPVLERIGNSRAFKYGIEVVPTMLIFKNGQVMNTLEGFRSESEILEEMAKYMEE